MIALARMRLNAYAKGGRVWPPAIATVVLLGIMYGGGVGPPAPTFGYAALVLFPVIAWQSKLVLDAEPDVQRRLARVSVGAPREALAGIACALVAGLAVSAAAVVVPLPLLLAREPAPGRPTMTTGTAAGVLAHLLMIPAAVAVGALASRAVTRAAGNGVAVLVSGVVLIIVLGLHGSVAPWLAPPIMAMSRSLAAPVFPSAGAFLLLCGWAVAWCAVAFTAYAVVRRSRT
ncbi:hypothetical protein [Mangrovihabitans endophyticus]|uniref:Uncharacterized protein n=1 Tax=Mangrovihabitans endophyticus TaxID=1751298 RepID=A0A8J3C1B8_9ACTN|nr:hypothetical protein [Mangrovihabitans endophyticus]GGK93044.1 hypothetical protein GCM10012284_28710 [Mangrovihabitans endophyticus]